MARKRPHSHEDLHERLKDTAYAVEYLEAALKDMPAVFLRALRNVAEARGMTRETTLNRENLYAALSERGNPVLNSVIVDVLGMRLSVELKPAA